MSEVINMQPLKGEVRGQGYPRRGGAGRVDLAKRVIQVHAIGAHGRVLTSRALARGKFIEWCVRLPTGCVVAMEASSSAHHWGRKLVSMGLDARIISAQLVEPYRTQCARARTTPTTRPRSARRPHVRRCALSPSSRSSGRACCACTDCARGSRKAAALHQSHPRSPCRVRAGVPSGPTIAAGRHVQRQSG